MATRWKLLPLASCLALTGCLIVAIDADDDEHYARGHITEHFDGVSSVQINTTSGDCVIHTREGRSAEARVEYRVRPGDAMTPEMHVVAGGQLVISEHWKNGSGHVEWTLFVPPNTPVTFTSSSGSLTAEGLSGAVSAKSASGEITLRRVTGSINASTSSGDIRLQDCTGNVQVSSVSGTVRRS